MSRIAGLLVAAGLLGLAPCATATTATDRSASCEWRAPAHDPFRGDVPGAVDDYSDIPASTRKRLKSRMEQFAYDDIVAIRHDAIEGNFRYEPALLDMHFGNRRICAKVTRQTWQPDHEERGLVYCEDGHCIVVPLVCRNVSRVIRRHGVGVMGGPGAAPTHPLSFDAPAAGLSPVPGMAQEPPTTHILESPPPTLQRLPPATDVPLTPAPLPPATPAPPPEVPPVVTPPPTVPQPLPAQEPAPPPLPPLPGMPPLPPVPAIPEPATWLLWAGGLGAFVLWRARRRIMQARPAWRNRQTPTESRQCPEPTR